MFMTPSDPVVKTLPPNRHIRLRISFLPYLAPLFLAVVLFIGGCGKKQDIVAKAGKMVITADEFKDHLLKRYRTVELASRRTLEDRKREVRQLVENKLKLQDAYRLGLDKDSLVLAKAHETEKQAAIQELYKVEIMDKIIPPDAVKKYYDKMGEEIRARHILLKTYVDMTDSEKDTVRARAERVYQQLLNGADFDSLAKAVSEDVTTAQRGGDLGYFTWGKMVDEFQEAAFALKVGEMSGIVESPYGYHIIKLEDRRVNEKRKPFAEVEEEIRMNLRRQYQEDLNKAAQAYLDSLKAARGLKFDYANIQKILDKVSDPNVPRNQSYFSNFTDEEKQWVVATMGADTIRVKELEAEIAKTGRPPKWRDQKAIVKMVERMVLPDLLFDRAKELGLLKHQSVKDAFKNTLETEMIRRVEEIQVDDKIDLSEPKLLTYYKDHTDEFMTDSTVTVQEIYVLIDEKKGKNKAFAQKLAERARNGENFTKLVRKYSERKSALGRDGKIGPITSRQYGAMGKAAFALEVGEISDPIKMGRRGWSVIKLLEKNPARVKPFEECRKQVERAYRRQQSEKLRTAWMDDLEKRYPVTIYEEKLMAILPPPEKTEKDTTTTTKPEPKITTIPIDKNKGN